MTTSGWSKWIDCGRPQRWQDNKILNVLSSPTTTTDGRRADVFVVAADRQIWHMDKDKYWFCRGKPPAQCSEDFPPSCVARGNELIDCFVVGYQDKQLYEIYMYPKFTPDAPAGLRYLPEWSNARKLDNWCKIGSPGWTNLDSAPAAVSLAEDLMYVFVCGQDRKIYQAKIKLNQQCLDKYCDFNERYQCIDWTIPSNFEVNFTVGGQYDPVKAALSCTRLDANSLYCLALDDRGQLHRNYSRNGQWVGWQLFGFPWANNPPTMPPHGRKETVLFAPAITSWNAERMDVFVTGTDMQMWQRTWTSESKNYDQGWGFWLLRGAPKGVLNRYGTHHSIQNSSPACFSRGHQLIDCFVRGDDYHLYQITHTP